MTANFAKAVVLIQAVRAQHALIPVNIQDDSLLGQALNERESDRTDSTEEIEPVDEAQE